MFRENDWINEVGRGQATISVAVRHPQVQHKVRIQDFERWLESQGRTPAEVVSKADSEDFSDMKFLERRRRRAGALPLILADSPAAECSASVNLRARVEGNQLSGHV